MELKNPELTGKIIGAAIEVHRELGPGQPELAYQEALADELHRQDIACRTEVPLPLNYDGLKLDCGYRLDLLVREEVVVELKAVETLLPIHSAQLMTYLRLGSWRFGLLLNFHVPLLKEGIRRMVCDQRQPLIHPLPARISPAEGTTVTADELSSIVIAAATRVHSQLGPGLLASAYQACMMHELSRSGLTARIGVKVPLTFKNRPLKASGTLDLLAGEQLPVQLLSVAEITPVHIAATSNLLRQSRRPTGLILNFNIERMTDGIRRCFPQPAPPCPPSSVMNS